VKFLTTISIKKAWYIYVIVHLAVIVYWMASEAYDHYPRFEGGSMGRAGILRVIYDNIESHKEKTGSYPETLDTIGYYVEEAEIIYLDANEFFSTYVGEDYSEWLRYDIRKDEVVLTDWGDDHKPGGIGTNMDMYYPPPGYFSLKFNFGFITTKYFWKAIGLGLILAFLGTLPLYGIWCYNFAGDKYSAKGMIVVIVCTLVVLYFEAGLTFPIVYDCVYLYRK